MSSVGLALLKSSWSSLQAMKAKVDKARTVHKRKKLAAEYQEQLDRFNETERILKASLEPWDQQPGTVGFNAYARHKVAGAMMGATFACSEDRKAQPYQLMLAALTTAQSSVRRLGVSWPTGSGKTRGMLDVLDNWYASDRGKIAIFPTSTIANNFIIELMNNPGQWRDFVTREASRQSVELYSAKNNLNMPFIKDTIALTGRLGRLGSDGYPGGPLRIFSYSQAGGSGAFGTQPNAVFKIPRRTKNPYDNCDVILDEIHNITRPDLSDKADKTVRIGILADALYTAKNIRLVALSATWFETQVSEYTDILKIVKGLENRDSATDEGFLLYYNQFPKEIFATTVPVNPRLTLPGVVEVPLTGDSRAKYRQKQKDFTKNPPKRQSPDVALSRYCNNSLFASRQTDETLASAGEKSFSSKFDTIVEYIRNDPNKKRLLLIHRESGLKTLVATLQQRLRLPARASQQCTGRAVCLSYVNDESEEDTAVLKEFNTADKGLIVADRKHYSTGVSFLGVQEVIFVDVPETVTEYIQVLGRPLRMCGHAQLPEEQRVLNIVLFCATLPGEQDTADERLLQGIAEGLLEQNEVFSAMDAIAIDTNLYGPHSLKDGSWLTKTRDFLAGLMQ